MPSYILLASQVREAAAILTLCLGYNGLRSLDNP